MNIIFPASINYIENGCMTLSPQDGQDSVQKIVIKILATTPPILISTNLLNNNTYLSKIEIYVPAASVSAYKTATNWSYFAAKIYPIT
jgi:hypothetical protein